MMGATRRTVIGAAALCVPAGSQAAGVSTQGPRGAADLHLLVPAAPGGGWDGTAQAKRVCPQRPGEVGDRAQG